MRKTAVFSIIIILFYACNQTSITKITDDFNFTEGPVAISDSLILFTDQPSDKIIKYENGSISVFRNNNGVANGLFFRDEVLFLCMSDGTHAKKQGGRGIAKITNGILDTITNYYGGHPYIDPNDLVIDNKGQIIFTDPYYGEPHLKTQPYSGVYKIDVYGNVKMIIKNLERPNGIVLSNDNKYLFIADRGNQCLYKFKYNYDTAQDGKIIYNFSPDRGIDGMTFGKDNKIYAAAGKNETSGLYIISPTGKLLKFISLPEMATNTSISPNGTIYVTAGKSLYKININ